MRNEGNVEIRVSPYPIAYRALTPKRAECSNLLVPVALSSTHIAFGSIRMEPVFMLLGQSAATAAAMAIDDDMAVQDVEYAKLRERLLKDGQILKYAGSRRKSPEGSPINAANLPGAAIDNDAAELSGPWSVNNVTHPRVGDTYLHDGNSAKGECSARFTALFEKPGRYELRVSWPPNPNRATKVPVSIYSKGRLLKAVHVNQKESGLHGAFTSLGEFEFGENATVEISNRDTTGYVIVDAVQFLAVAP